MILSAVACENFLSQLHWDGAAQWRAAARQIWRLNPSDYDVAGYVKQQLPVGKAGLTYVVVREAGHLLPQVSAGQRKGRGRFRSRTAHGEAARLRLRLGRVLAPRTPHAHSPAPVIVAHSLTILCALTVLRLVGSTRARHGHDQSMDSQAEVVNLLRCSSD